MMRLELRMDVRDVERADAPPMPHMKKPYIVQEHMNDIYREQAMELYKRTEIDEFTDPAKIHTGPNNRFLVVRYGWYAFSFILDEGEVRGHELNERAITLCKALLVLDGGNREDGVLSWVTKPGTHGMVQEGVYRRR